VSAEIVTVGRELPANNEWLTEQLEQRGIEVTACSEVDEDGQRMAAALRAAMARAAVVLVVGARAAPAEAVGRPLELDREAQAWPLDEGRRIVAFLPGVPAELRATFERSLSPHLERWLPAIVGDLLARGGLTLATAESCTAGGLGAALTTVPGSSAWYRGGLIVYHDDLKRCLAGVSEASLARHGAVSEPVARELARGARERCGADIGVGLTGIAGPGGGSAEKPVGLVHLAWEQDGLSSHVELRLGGGRDRVRRRAVTAALDRLRRHLVGGG
jgi:PncC family amidohydrolase